MAGVSLTQHELMNDSFLYAIILLDKPYIARVYDKMVSSLLRIFQRVLILSMSFLELRNFMNPSEFMPFSDHYCIAIEKPYCIRAVAYCMHKVAYAIMPV